MEPLAEHAVVLARRDGFRPEIGDLYEQADDLMRDAGPVPGAAAVLLIDPWAVLQSHCRQVLARLDELDKPWVQVVVVWNRKDAEMAAAEGELRRALAEAMPSGSAPGAVRPHSSRGRASPRSATSLRRSRTPCGTPRDST